jgi:hypothetical protein
MSVPSSQRREYLAGKKREAREKARAEGNCVICVRNSADPDLVTCADCRNNVKDWQQRQRREASHA